MPNSKHNIKLVIDQYKEVVIIGNGPSGICLSYFLAGNWPYWNKSKVTDEYLQMRLENIDEKQSLIQHDLEFLSDGLEGRSNNPVALLYDYLKNPGGDYGMDLPSCIDWKYEANREVDHVVIGKTDQAGGAWQSFAGNHLTVSLSKWMELPDYTFDNLRVDNKYEYNSNNNKKPGRVTANEVRDYYQNYVKKKQLEKYLMNNATVHSARKITDPQTNEELWEVMGVVQLMFNTNSATKQVKSEKFEFRFVCKYLVLAIGTTDISNELHVQGEHLSFVLRSIRELEEKIKKNITKVRKHPLLVVGSGLSAADCILIANKYRIRILHVMRSSVYDKTNLVYSKLPKSDYPEYHWVYDRMLQSKKDQNMQTNDSIDSSCTQQANYQLLDEHTVRQFTSSRTCVLHNLTTNTDLIKKISYACVLIGHSANLNFLPAPIRSHLTVNPAKPLSKENPINVDPYSLETVDCKNLFGMGPIVGDNFVRYGTAGALAITNSLWKSKNFTN